MNTTNMILVNLFSPFLVFGEMEESSSDKKKFASNREYQLVNMVFDPENPGQKSLGTISKQDQDYSGKTIESVLYRKNKLFVSNVLGQPDEIKRRFRKIYYVYNSPTVNFRNFSQKSAPLVILFKNGMVSEIRY